MTIPDRKAAARTATSNPLSESEIAVLEALASEGAPIVARLASGVTAFRTQLLFVDPERRFLLIKASDDTAANATLLAGARANLLAVLDEWRIEFSADSPRPDVHGGARAVRLAFPAAVSIGRRRQQERAPVPMHSSLRCFGRSGAGAAFEAAVTDVSEGGVGLLQELTAHPPEPGTCLSGCRLERPGMDPVPVDLEVRYAEPAALPDGRPGLKVGYRFLNPAPETLALIGELLRATR